LVSLPIQLTFFLAEGADASSRCVTAEPPTLKITMFKNTGADAARKDKKMP
jgi:hypothetical protein